MRAALAPVLALAACGGTVKIAEGTSDLGPTASTGWTDSPYEDPPTGGTTTVPVADPFEDATLLVVSPASGSFLPIEDPQAFEALLLAKDGSALDGGDIEWSTALDPSWSALGEAFDDEPLDVGLHDVTAFIELPNGDRLSYTVGGVLVQSKFAGTYSGLFTVDGAYNGIVFTCSGTGTTEVEPYGVKITGDADCLVSILGIDLPLAFLFDLDNADGVVDGTAGADIFGLFTYDFPASGTLEPLADGLSIDFAGSVPFTGVSIDGSYDAERVSL